MKTKIYIFTLFLFVGINAIQAQEWGYVSTLTGEEMRKICTQGLDTVYIVGENGLIARSIDKGETWEKQYFPTKAALNDIIFIDYYTGFAVGEQGTILKTTDAGETWEQRPIDATSNLNAIAATELNNIWAVGDNSLILHSSDAGATWEQVNILPETNVQLSDIAFRGSLGYFTGNYGTIYKTEDSGITWNKQTIIEQTNTSWYTGIYSINVMENKTYLLVGDYLYSTKDQTNWEPVLDNDNIEVMLHSNLFFLNDSVGYTSNVALYTGGDVGGLIIMKTTDSGKNWEMVKDTALCCYNFAYSSQIKMINDTLGYAIFSEVLLKIPAIPTQSQGGIKKIKDDNSITIIEIGKDELLLQSTFSSIVSVEFLNTSGNIMKKRQISGIAKDVKININNLPKGVYIVKVIYNNNLVSIEKFIKK